MSSLYKMELTEQEKVVLEEMRHFLSLNLGVTVTGNRCTLRWYNKNKQLMQVHMIVESLTTPEEVEKEHERIERYNRLQKKHPNLAEELNYAETGEHSQ